LGLDTGSDERMTTTENRDWGADSGTIANITPRHSPNPQSPIPNSPRWARRGFTMIELMIVMSIVVILVGIAVPLYQRSILRARETILKNNLFTIRTVIDEYTYDKQKAPQSLQDLVTEGYLRDVPMDPITGNNTSWRVIMEEAMQSVNQTEPGIFDVKSGSDKTSSEGSPYAEW
jgi:general secretion pathway protein G